MPWPTYLVHHRNLLAEVWISRGFHHFNGFLLIDVARQARCPKLLGSLGKISRGSAWSLFFFRSSSVRPNVYPALNIDSQNDHLVEHSMASLLVLVNMLLLAPPLARLCFAPSHLWRCDRSPPDQVHIGSAAICTTRSP